MNQFQQRYGNDTHAITLEDVTFHVRLPTMQNKRFQMAVTAEVMDLDGEGNAKRREMSAAEMVIAQIEAFIKTCIDHVDGWDDFTVQRMLAMPSACDDLWFQVSELTREQEARAEASEKKPGPTLPGPQNGPGEKTSTGDLRTAAG